MVLAPRQKSAVSSGEISVDFNAASDLYAARTPDAVDQIPDCSRESVPTMPANRSVAMASSPIVCERMCNGVAPSCRSIQRTTFLIGSDSRAAAWRRGASSAPALSVQWCSPVCPVRVPLRDAATIASAVWTAASHRPAVVSGDQPTRSTEVGHSTSPLGSKRKAHPSRPRAVAVDSITSGLVEVETTGPLASRILGMTREDVLPDRDGPRTRVDRCGPAQAHPPLPSPR